MSAFLERKAGGRPLSGYGQIRTGSAKPLAENIAKSCANSFSEELFGDRARFTKGECFWARTIEGDVRETNHG